MKASDFDRRFDDGESVAVELDSSKLRRPAQEQRRVNVYKGQHSFHRTVQRYGSQSQRPQGPQDVLLLQGSRGT